MTVKELKDLLDRCPENAPVRMWAHSYSQYGDYEGSYSTEDIVVSYGPSVTNDDRNKGADFYVCIDTDEDATQHHRDENEEWQELTEHNDFLISN